MGATPAEGDLLLGRYTLGPLVGLGGTAKVFRAWDQEGGGTVAVKVFPPGSASPTRDGRREREVLTGVRHAGLIEIRDSGVDDEGFPFVVMDFIEGESLAARLRRGPVPPTVVAELGTTLAAALAHVHERGIVHRDIKPGNVLLSAEGETKLSDFGASFQQRLEEHTTQIKGIGSPAYMSPEQLRLEPLNQQTDIYSLGVTMFRLLTGRLPYEAGSHVALTYAILNTPPPKPSSLRRDLPPLLDEIVMKAIEKSPSQRYRSWLEFGKDITRAFMSLRPGPEVTTSDSEKFGKLRDMSFFKDFGEVELWEVVRVGNWQTIEPGTVLMREGEAGDSFYILVEGEVEVTLLTKPLAVLTPGASFGEMLYFADSVERRTTTVAARAKVIAMQIKFAAVRMASDACQNGFHKAFMRTLVERLAKANRLLAQAAA